MFSDVEFELEHFLAITASSKQNVSQNEIFVLAQNRGQCAKSLSTDQLVYSMSLQLRGAHFMRDNILSFLVK
jgi:hypothetical protein